MIGQIAYHFRNSKSVTDYFRKLGCSWSSKRVMWETVPTGDFVSFTIFTALFQLFYMKR